MESVDIEENPGVGYGVASLDQRLVLRALANQCTDR